MPEKFYEILEARFYRLGRLSQARSFLHWDTSTMMPPGGASSRGEQLAELQAVEHAIITDARTGDLIAEAWERRAELTPWQAANLREMRRLWGHATALSKNLVIALSRAACECEAAWRQARAEDDFPSVLPMFERLLGLIREMAGMKAQRLGVSVYDALLDEHDPGFKTAQIAPLFADLSAFLPDFFSQALIRQAERPQAKQLKGPFPVDQQRKLGVTFMKALGFDFNHGRLDTSLHPFSGGTPEDNRITTRYDEADFTPGLMGVLHETGHALYDRGLPADWRCQPVGDACGMSTHEGQSLLIEKQLCHSRPFLEYAAPIIAKAFGKSGPAWEADNLYRLYNRVEPNFIRADADEATYPAHVIVRYRLEKDLVEERIEARHLPEAWRSESKSLLGFVPPTDRQGCLQDIHWYDAAWGYFPSYVLGAITAAQLFDAAKRSGAAAAQDIAKGNFKPLTTWMREKVHSRGSFLLPQDLLEEATGRPLDVEIYKAHLKRRYLGGE